MLFRSHFSAPPGPNAAGQFNCQERELELVRLGDRTVLPVPRARIGLTVLATFILAAASAVAQHGIQVDRPPCVGWRVVLLGLPSPAEIPSIGLTVSRHFDSSGVTKPLLDTSRDFSAFPSLPIDDNTADTVTTYWLDSVRLTGDRTGGNWAKPGAPSESRFFDSVHGRWWCAQVMLDSSLGGCPVVWITLHDCPVVPGEACCGSIQVTLTKLDCGDDCCCYQVNVIQDEGGICAIHWAGLNYFGTTSFISNTHDTTAPFEDSTWYDIGTVITCPDASPDSVVIDFKDYYGRTICRWVDSVACESEPRISSSESPVQPHWMGRTTSTPGVIPNDVAVRRRHKNIAR